MKQAEGAWRLETSDLPSVTSYLSSLFVPIHRGQIKLGGIFFDHATHTKHGGIRADGFAHDLDPTAWDVVAITFIEQGDDLFFEQAVQRFGIGRILFLMVVVIAILADGPAVGPIVPFDPPPIENA